MLLFPVTIISYGQTITNKKIDINGITGSISAIGELHPTLLEAPAGSNKSTIWMGELRVAGIDANGNVHGAFVNNSWQTDFFQGPVMGTGFYSLANDSIWNQVWKINKTTIDSFRLGLFSIIPPEILSWPGNGDVAQGQALQLAPYVDVNGDNFYQPLDGDYPCIRGDQALFTIFNDDRNNHFTNSMKLKIEVHAMMFAYKSPGSWLDSVIFLNYKIYNRSDTVYYNTSFANFIDFDIGDYSDDYVGCDVSRHLYFGYNGDTNDGASPNPAPGTYGANPPATGVAILQGPPADINDGIDNDKDGLLDEPGENCGMSYFIYYNNDFSVMGNPSTAAEYFGYMNGFWKDGTPATYGGNGFGGSQVSNYMFPGDTDPTNGPPWDESNAGNIPGDRRVLGVTGKFTFLPGQVACYDIAFVYGRGTNGNESSVDVIRERTDSARIFHAANPFCACTTYPVGIGQISTAPDIRVLPNPFSDRITIEYATKSSNCYFELLDATGRICLTQKISTTSTTIDVQNLPAGIYLLNFVDGTYTTNLRLVKQ